jgi:hypothetical protein
LTTNETQFKVTLIISSIMATYTTNIEALPPLVSGVPETQVNAIFAGDALQDADVVSARNQYHDRKILTLTSTPLATAEELVVAKRRKHMVESSNFDGPVPLWATQMQQNMQVMSRSMSIESQRSMNRSLRATSDPISPVIRLDGSSPLDNGVWFPADHVALLESTGNQLNPLLAFYGLPQQGNLSQKRFELKRHLGVTL